MNPRADAVDRAIQIANFSPCAKSKRGVVIWSDSRIIGAGFNSLPVPASCDGSATCRTSCSARCIHAEERALVHAMRSGYTLRGAEMLHVKTVDGKLVAGGGPSCSSCARSVLEAGIAGFWLYEERPADIVEVALSAIEPPIPRLELMPREARWVRYPIDEFHRLTMLACGLPPLPRT